MNKTTAIIAKMNLGIFLIFFGISIFSAIFLLSGLLALFFFNIGFIVNTIISTLGPFHKFLTESGILLFYGLLLLDLSLVFQLKYEMFLFEDVNKWWKGELK